MFVSARKTYIYSWFYAVATKISDLKFSPAKEGVAYASINPNIGIFQFAPRCQKKKFRSNRTK